MSVDDGCEGSEFEGAEKSPLDAGEKPSFSSREVSRDAAGHHGPPPPPRSGRSPFGYLYVHNPFYAVSAALMLYAVRAAYGELEIGAINCWAMAGTLAAYTLGLAAFGIAIVRFGKVWDDARSIFLITLLLLLSLSIVADDLFVGVGAVEEGDLLVLAGAAFASAVVEAILLLTPIACGWRLRGPLHLFLWGYFVAPWALSLVIDSDRAWATEWLLAAVPVATALSTLTLVPAVRLGEAAAARSGTPWAWPWFPFSAFAILIGGAVLRTYALTMTYGQTGPIWEVTTGSGPNLIVFTTAWAPYFLVPVLLAVLWLFLESALTGGRRERVHLLLAAAPAVTLLTPRPGRETVTAEFYDAVTASLGSPVWLTLLLVIAFLFAARLRGVREAGTGAAIAALALLVVHPDTVGPSTLRTPPVAGLLAAATVLAAVGLRTKRSLAWAAAAAAATLAVRLGLVETDLDPWKNAVAVHVAWASAVAIGLAFRDPLGRALRVGGALLGPLAAVGLAVDGDIAADMPVWPTAYVAAVAAGLAGVAFVGRSRWYGGAAAVVAAIACYEFAATGFREAARVAGTPAVTAAVWSVAALLIAAGISCAKASWLPRASRPFGQSDAAN